MPVKAVKEEGDCLALKLHLLLNQLVCSEEPSLHQEQEVT